MPLLTEFWTGPRFSNFMDSSFEFKNVKELLPIIGCCRSLAAADHRPAGLIRPINHPF
jgi:hypothetical protein